MTNWLKSKLISYGITNFEMSMPLANYQPAILSENYVFVSGNLPINNGSIIHTGKCDLDLNTNEIKNCIELATSNMLISVCNIIDKKNLNADYIKCVNIKGYINCTEKFSEHSNVFNYCSDYIVKIFGNVKGHHTRTVIGVNSLPLNSPVEIDGIFFFKH